MFYKHICQPQLTIRGARQTDAAGNVSAVSDPITIELTTLSVDPITGAELFYTNPVRNQLALVSESLITEVKLYAISGQKVLEVSPGRRKVSMDMSSLRKGLYVMKISTQTSPKLAKLIKQ